ncbi:T9SS type A sorting domain-containing protein [Plebeiibacterium marinum]|uniref:T9SS type A sorting domain-containing protein n=1 Tax=Plebeiibacterium marinum TaxID=2992111 RepID=A0AAE3MC53_9BACT|nr:T9SS type A sorting domain-containing protein [Plebeiobacterium marinum]MCW3805026.1 T9SS type A sorting domain-containing protein [Plebeiobacterium marinum]
MKKILFIVPFCVCCFVNAQLNIANVNTDYIIDFDHTVDGINNEVFSAAGFSPVPATGQLNSNGIIVKGFSDGDVGFGEENISNDMTRGNSVGGVRYGGLYAFEVEEGNYALGFQPGETDFTPGEIILKVMNNEAGNIGEFGVTYDLWCFNDQDRSNSLTMSYSLDNIEYTVLSESEFISPEVQAGTPVWTKNTVSVSVSALVADNQCVYLKWFSDDVSGTDSRDEFAIDNIVVNASSAGNQTSNSDRNAVGVCVYPNPFQDKVYVKANNSIISVKVFNTRGVVLIHRNRINEHGAVFETGQLPKGIYLVEISVESGETQYKKLIKR